MASRTGVADRAGHHLWVALRRRDLISGYRYSAVLPGFGVAAWLFAYYAAFESLTSTAPYSTEHAAFHTTSRRRPCRP